VWSCGDYDVVETVGNIDGSTRYYFDTGKLVAVVVLGVGAGCIAGAPSFTEPACATPSCTYPYPDASVDAP
jgi:hypothetical protein